LAGALWIIWVKIRQLTNILFCGYRRLEIREQSRNLYSPGHRVPQRVITEYSVQIKSKSGFASEFDPQLTQKSSKSKIAMKYTACLTKHLMHHTESRIAKTCK
jgi:hypothetical protein